MLSLASQDDLVWKHLYQSFPWVNMTHVIFQPLMQKRAQQRNVWTSSTYQENWQPPLCHWLFKQIVFLSKIPRCHAICFWPLFLLYLSKYITQFLFLGVGCIKSVSQDRLWLTSRRHVYGIFSTQFHQSPTTYDRHTSVKWYMWTKFSKGTFMYTW